MRRWKWSVLDHTCAPVPLWCSSMWDLVNESRCCQERPIGSSCNSNSASAAGFVFSEHTSNGSGEETSSGTLMKKEREQKQCAPDDVVFISAWQSQRERDGCCRSDSCSTLKQELSSAAAWRGRWAEMRGDGADGSRNLSAQVSEVSPSKQYADVVIAKYSYQSIIDAGLLSCTREHCIPAWTEPPTHDCVLYEPQTDILFVPNQRK